MIDQAQREKIVSMYVRGMGYHEIARELGMKYHTVYNLIFKSVVKDLPMQLITEIYKIGFPLKVISMDPGCFLVLIRTGGIVKLYDIINYRIGKEIYSREYSASMNPPADDKSSE